MTAPVINVRGIGKRYRVVAPTERPNTLRDAVALSARRILGAVRGIGRRRATDDGANTFWALREIDFDVHPGEVVGIIGANGAGKSTLLKVLSRITTPTEGEVHIRGRVGSLLEVGTGFHSELTGRENIYLSGAILGMRREEIRRKFDEIVSFAEVGPFIDTPVKHYSSGMHLRLGFAVAAHLEPEILIVDEVLAVGDLRFQRKCLGRMHSVAREGRTVLFVSHNMPAVSRLCTRAIVLQRGRVVGDGDVGEAIALYSSEGFGELQAGWERPSSAHRSALEFSTLRCSLEGEQPRLQLRLEITLHSREAHRDAFVAVDILHGSGTPIMQALPVPEPFIPHADGVHHLVLNVELPPLVPGEYLLTLWAGSHNTETLDRVDAVARFEVLDSPTPGRSYPHTPDHGFIVPHARVLRYEVER